MITSIPPFSTDPESFWTDLDLEHMVQTIESCLTAHSINAKITAYPSGTVFTLFGVEMARGIRISKVSSLIPEISRALCVIGVTILENVPGTSHAGILVTNTVRRVLPLAKVLNTKTFDESISPLTMMLGEDILGNPVNVDLSRMPHLLLAGTTFSGKSVLLHTMMISLLFKSSPTEVRLLMVDTNQLELTSYDDIPHLLSPVITDVQEAANALNWIVAEMERRYKLLRALGVRNLEGYNCRISEAEFIGRAIPDPYWRPGFSKTNTQPTLCKMPSLVVCIDDYSDLLLWSESLEEKLITISKQGHAVGIHLILTTRNPLPSVVTNRIKSNIPARIALTVSAKSDSRLILDSEGAEALYGAGDMLFAHPDAIGLTRLQAPYVTEKDIKIVVESLKVLGKTYYIKGIIEDEYDTEISVEQELDVLFDQAVSFVLEARRATVSGVQRQFRIGYHRAALLITQMENLGVVSPPDSNGVRLVLAPPTKE